MPHHSGNKLIDPAFLFEKVQLRSGMHIADFGSGRTGNFVFPAAEIVGVHGIVYAVDILKDVLQAIMKRAASDGLLNVHTVWGDVERVGSCAIPEKSLDVVWMINALIFIKNRDAALEEAARLLKERGRLMIVDWANEGLAFCPPREWFVDFEAIERWARAHGFVVEQTFGFGKYHRGIVLYKGAL